MNELISKVTVKCPFCERLFLMTRPLFVAERERTACPACRRAAEENTKAMFAGPTSDAASKQKGTP